MAAVTVPLPKSKASKRTRHETILFYTCIAPFILGILFFDLIPMGASLVLSFTQWDILTPPKFIGLQNYIKAFTQDPNFPIILKVTFKYALVAVPLRLASGLLLAILLNEATRGVGFFRTAFYLPAIVSSVAAAVLWTWILNPVYGPVNGLLALFHINGPQWFTDPKFALWGLIMMAPWGVGGEMLIFLAGLKGIDKQLYEAAELDGAGRLSKFFKITLPMLSPALFFNLVMSVIGALQSFDTAYVISTARAGTLGGPLKSTLFYMIYLYNRAFAGSEMGYASALGWILFAIIMVLTLLVLRSSSLWVFYEAERKH
ncbi:MAG TPA: sugar ABC transporter permease [Anaerolineaceae bacterium]|jgi:multiple sugar transport system permease protein